MNYRHATVTFANKVLHSKFKWGTNDCNTIALEFIKEVFPNVPDLRDSVIAKYNSKKSAVELYKTFDYTWESFLETNGFVLVDPMFFQPGDIHMHDMGKVLKALSINVGDTNLIADPKHGISLRSVFDLHNEHKLIAYRFRG